MHKIYTEAVNAFLQEGCERASGSTPTTTELATAYRDWAERNDRIPISAIAFGKAMVALGYVGYRRSAAVCYPGIKINAP